MKNNKVMVLGTLFIAVLLTILVGSVDAFSPVKKHSLSALKEKIDKSHQNSESNDALINVKKVRKDPSLLTRVILFIKKKKQSFMKKMQCFYRHHFYLSVFVVGLFSALSLYYLKQYGIPFLYDLIKKYKDSQKLIAQSSQSAESMQKNPPPLKETMTQSETLQPLPHQEVVQEPVKQDIIDKKSEPVEKVATQDTVQSQNQFLNQKVETQTTESNSVQEIALPVAKVRSAQEINESTNLYKNTTTFINKTLTDQIDRFKELKNEYETAKKRAQASPHNIKLYNDSLKKEQIVADYKNKLIQATQEVVRKIDSSDFLNKYGIVKDLTEHDLGKPRKAIIPNKQSRVVTEAAAYEDYYGNVINEKDRQDFQTRALEEQKKQHQEFNYMHGILNKVLLPFVQSL